MMIIENVKILKDGRPEFAVRLMLEAATGASGPERSCRLTVLREREEEHVHVAPDFAGALANWRRDLEADGLLPAVAGARRDVHVSGMQRDMGAGSHGYVIDQYEPGRPHRTIMIFEPLAENDYGKLVTLAEQKQYMLDVMRRGRPAR